MELLTIEPTLFRAAIDTVEIGRKNGIKSGSGAVIYDQDKECLKDAWLNQRTQKKIFETAKRVSIPVFCSVNGKKGSPVSATP